MMMHDNLQSYLLDKNISDYLHSKTLADIQHNYQDKREIPLFPAQFLLNPIETEKKAIKLSTFLNVPLENLISRISK